MFTGQLILCTQRMLRRGSNTFWEDTLVPTRRVEDTANCYQLTISQPSSHSPASPTSRLFKKQRKQNRTQSHHHLAASASTRVWHARYWQPQRPIFLFLCCCFKSKARAVIRKHKHTDPLTRRGRRSGRERTLTAILPSPCSGCNGAQLEQAGGGGCQPGHVTGPPESCHDQCPRRGSAADARAQKDAPHQSQVLSSREPTRQMWVAGFS